MKIIKINENQIKCVLYKDDLEERQVKVNELAVGSDKAKELIRHIMVKAQTELGFELNDKPIMIEAIPVKPDSLMLLITRVDNPEDKAGLLRAKIEENLKLLTGEDVEVEPLNPDKPLDLSAEALAAEEKAQEEIHLPFGDKDDDKQDDDEEEDNLPFKAGPSWRDADAEKKVKRPEESKVNFKCFSFESLEQVINAAKHLPNYYDSDNSLYKDKRVGRFYLVVTGGRNTEREMKGVYLKLGEYGRNERVNKYTAGYFKEYYSLIIANDALQKLEEL